MFLVVFTSACISTKLTSFESCDGVDSEHAVNPESLRLHRLLKQWPSREVSPAHSGML